MEVGGKGLLSLLLDGLTVPLSLSPLEFWPVSSLASSISTRTCTSPTWRSTLLVTDPAWVGWDKGQL